MITVWEEVFASLPDDAFFEVVRNYLGPVETPYHKPELVGRLSTFLRGTPANETALALLNREDVRFLALIDITEDPTERELRDLFSGVPYPVFRERLLNLEERLLIWSRIKEGERRYALTPTGAAAAEAGRVIFTYVALPEKIQAIEDFDQKIVRPIFEGMEQLAGSPDFRLVVCMDHLTPISIRTHTGEPVPVLLYDSRQNGPKSNASYNEKNGKLSDILLSDGKQFFEKLLQKEEKLS